MMVRVLTLLLLVSALHAQLVDGVLTDSVTHLPIPDVIVTLLGPSRYNGTTDETGAFHIGPVKPGKYVLNIVKAGFVLPLARQASFAVDSDTRLSVEMDPLGVVEGRVRYPDGRPAPRASVFLNGPATAGRTVIADIGGHFLFDDVKPGTYIVYASAAAGDPKPEGEVWAPTYFPSTTDRAAAEPIRVATGAIWIQEIRLRSVPARRIRGIVRDEAGRPASGVSVALNLSPGERQMTQTGEDGGFDFVAREGEWHLAASRKDGDLERQGFQNVTVSRHDLENVEIRLAVPFSVPIIVECDEAGDALRRFAPMIMLARQDAPSMIRPASDMLQNVYPGRYTIQALGASPGQYIESIKLGEVDVYGRPFDLWDGSLPIRIVYRGGAPVVRGTVNSTAGAMVVIFNADASTGDTTRTIAGAGGNFEFRNLRPGDYYIVALDRVDQTIATPAFRRVVLPLAEKLHLEKGGVVTLDLKVVQWPQ